VRQPFSAARFRCMIEAESLTERTMITLYTWGTPNGRKVSIALEEMGLPYEVKPVDIGKDVQFTPDYVTIAPNSKIPAIVDHDAPGGALSIFESGAILEYLAEKSGRFMPATEPGRSKVREWLYWQIGGLGPNLGQLGYFARRAPEPMPIAIARFRDESARLIQVMERQLSRHAYLAGPDYTVADMCSYAWTLGGLPGLKVLAGEALGPTPAVDRWLATLGAREGVIRGMAIPKV
jgi:GST-like protein